MMERIERKKGGWEASIHLSRKGATSERGGNSKCTLEHKRCVSCLHNSASGYMIMQAPWGPGNYIKMHSFIPKFVSNILEALMHYQLMILYSNYHWIIFFVPLLLLNYLKKHKMAPSLWLIIKKKFTENPRVEGDNALAT